jgi:hypothetical protein
MLKIGAASGDLLQHRAVSERAREGLLHTEIRATVLGSATAGLSPQSDHNLMQQIAMQRRKRDDAVDEKFML